jgi:predicted TIM-barrel fold metal-dependent hydrolase
MGEKHRPIRSRRLLGLGLGLGLGLLFGSLGCGSPRGVDYDGRRLPVVDMHLHPGEWEGIPEDTQRYIGSRFPFPLNLNAKTTADGILSAEGILAEMDKGGVAQAVLFAVYSPRTVGITTNERVIADTAKSPDRLFGLASLRLDAFRTDRDAELARLRAALKNPSMIGIKLAHAHQHVRMDDPFYFGIYQLAAELKKPLYLHTGSSPFPGTSREPPYTDPTYLEAAIQSHPGAIFILGHLGYNFTDQKLGGLDACIRLAKAYSNVYVEPSALGSKGSDPTGENLKQSMTKLREAGLVDRIIYGSDGPQSPGFVKDYLARTIVAMRASGYTADEAQAVLSGNFARVFNVPALK